MNATKIVFSPTGGTEKVADALAGELAGTDGVVTRVDLRDSHAGAEGVSLDANALAVIAAPCYAGRVPAVAMERLGTIAGNGAKAVVAIAYGKTVPMTTRCWNSRTAPRQRDLLWSRRSRPSRSIRSRVSLPPASRARAKFGRSRCSHGRLRERCSARPVVMSQFPAIVRIAKRVRCRWFPRRRTCARRAVRALRAVRWAPSTPRALQCPRSAASRACAAWRSVLSRRAA